MTRDEVAVRPVVGAVDRRVLPYVEFTPFAFAKPTTACHEFNAIDASPRTRKSVWSPKAADIGDNILLDRHPGVADLVELCLREPVVLAVLAEREVISRRATGSRTARRLSSASGRTSCRRSPCTSAATAYTSSGSRRTARSPRRAGSPRSFRSCATTRQSGSPGRARRTRRAEQVERLDEARGRFPDSRVLSVVMTSNVMRSAGPQLRHQHVVAGGSLDLERDVVLLQPRLRDRAPILSTGPDERQQTADVTRRVAGTTEMCSLGHSGENAAGASYRQRGTTHSSEEQLPAHALDVATSGLFIARCIHPPPSCE